MIPTSNVLLVKSTGRSLASVGKLGIWEQQAVIPHTKAYCQLGIEKEKDLAQTLAS